MSMEVKIYDKKRQLEEIKHFSIEKNLMRIEIILKKSQKIKEVFGSCYVIALTDKMITDFYIKQFIRLFVKPYHKWRLENSKLLKNMILMHRKKNRNHWKDNLLKECSNKEQIDQIPILLDIEDLLKEVKILEKNGHYSRLKKGMLELCQFNNIYLSKDTQKVKEIFEKVYRACDKQTPECHIMAK